MIVVGENSEMMFVVGDHVDVTADAYQSTGGAQVGAAGQRAAPPTVTAAVVEGVALRLKPWSDVGIRRCSFAEDFLPEDFFFGTLPPALRACDRPIAIACFLLVTFFPEPLFKRHACAHALVFDFL